MSPFPLLLGLMTAIAFFFSMYDADAKVMPGVWDGTCKPITNKYQHRNPNTERYEVGRTDTEKQAGYIPAALQGTNEDILDCLPPMTNMGPK